MKLSCRAWSGNHLGKKGRGAKSGSAGTAGDASLDGEDRSAAPTGAAQVSQAQAAQRPGDTAGAGKAGRKTKGNGVMPRDSRGSK